MFSVWELGICACECPQRPRKGVGDPGTRTSIPAVASKAESVNQ